MINFKITKGRLADGISINSREFARDNNISAVSLRTLIARDKSVVPISRRGNVLFYNINDLTTWFKNNNAIFKANKHHKDYLCNSCGFYTTNDRKSDEYKCCVGCEKGVAASKVISDAKENGGLTMKVNVISTAKNRTKIADIMAGRELDNLISDNWMEL